MEEWQEFWKDAAAIAESLGNEIAELAEEVTAEAQYILYSHWEDFKQVLTELWLDSELDFEDINRVNWDATFTDRTIPDPATHPACVGCTNYSGTSFGGNFLVCGIHPYGCDSDTCTDWEGEHDRN
jgi:hypothetical protein